MSADTREPVAADYDSVEAATEALDRYPVLLVRTYHTSGGAKSTFHTHLECPHVRTHGRGAFTAKDAAVIARMWDISECDACSARWDADGGV